MKPAVWLTAGRHGGAAGGLPALGLALQAGERAPWRVVAGRRRVRLVRWIGIPLAAAAVLILVIGIGQQRRQAASAYGALQAAVKAWEGLAAARLEQRLGDCRQICAQAADYLSALMYDAPLLPFSADSVLSLADWSAGYARAPLAVLEGDACADHMRVVANLVLPLYAAQRGAFPPDLAALKTWLPANVGGMPSAMLAALPGCPAGQWEYHPPAGAIPMLGDLVISCPRHPQANLVWDPAYAVRLHNHWIEEERRRLASDPDLRRLLARAEGLRDMATCGFAPWEQVERAYLDVLEVAPTNSTSRSFLGRMYTGWGRYREALQMMAGQGDWWCLLNTAFCYDALGIRRQDALAIYDYLERQDDATFLPWARLGLEQPTWPAAMKIGPAPGEVLLQPAGWQVSASDSATEFGMVDPARALDGNPATRWTVGPDGQSPGTWFRVDFPQPTLVSRVVLDHQGAQPFYLNDYPRGFVAEVSVDGKTWEQVGAVGGGPMRPAAAVLDPPRAIRSVRFTLTARHTPEWWSIHEVMVFGPEGTR